MKAGVDFGSTLVKAVWIADGKYRFSSTANKSLDELVKELRDSNVTDIRIAGIGYGNMLDAFAGFKTSKSTAKDLLKEEKKLQAAGAMRLLNSQGTQLKNCIIASLGTGTSYVAVRWGFVVPLPLGNSIGGGYLLGMGKTLGIDSYAQIVDLAQKGRSLDLYVKEKIPATTGSMQGELVIAHFGKADATARKEDILATAVHTVAAQTARDIAVICGASWLLKGIQDVVYIGSTVSRNHLLQQLLTKYSTMLGKKTHFPANGEFALALGAYHNSN